MSGTHVVAQGETLYRIAAQHGFPNWRTLYDHESNETLRALRPNPHVLQPGDVVQIPDVPKTPLLEVPLDTRVTVVRVPVEQQLFRLLVVSDRREPVADTEYTLSFDGGERRGTTDAAGMLHETIPIAVRRVTLTAGGMEQELEIGRLDPLRDDTVDGGVAGAKARLRNLGHFVLRIDGERTTAFAEALRRFQQQQDMSATGVLDEATRAALQRVHGS